MLSAVAIFLVIVVVLLLIGGGVSVAINFQDVIFGLVMLLVGLGLIGVGVMLLVKYGGGVGAFGIFLSLFGGFFVWFGQAIMRDTL